MNGAGQYLYRRRHRNNARITYDARRESLMTPLLS